MRRLFLVALALTILLPLLAVMLVFLAAAGVSTAQCGIPLGATGPVGGVPAADVPLFEGAAARFGLGARGPSILAAINYVESTFGTSNLAGVHSGTNSAGAAGPMQFLAGTWATEAVNAPGGLQAANLKVAELYVNAFALLARTNNTLIVPGNMGDMATMVTSAMTMLERVKSGEAKPAAAA